MDHKELSDDISEIFSEVEQLKELVKVLYKKDKERKRENDLLKRQIASMSREHTRDMQIIRGLQKTLNKVHIQAQKNKEKKELGEAVENSDDKCEAPLPPVVAKSARPMGGEEKKKIKKKSWFNCRTSTPIPLVTGESIIINEYDEVLNPCLYMDTTTGRYAVPLSGRYRFTIWMKTRGGRGRVKSFLCRDEGREKILVDTLERSDGFWHISDVSCDCKNEEEVWVEILRETGDAKVTVEIYGGLEE